MPAKKIKTKKPMGEYTCREFMYCTSKCPFGSYNQCIQGKLDDTLSETLEKAKPLMPESEYEMKKEKLKEVI